MIAPFPGQVQEMVKCQVGKLTWGTSILTSDFRVGRGFKKLPTIGRYNRVKIVGYLWYAGQKLNSRKTSDFIYGCSLAAQYKGFKNNPQTQSLRIYYNSSKFWDLFLLKLLQISNFEIFILMVLPYYVYGHFKSLLSRKYIWMQCKWPQYDMCTYFKCFSQMPYFFDNLNHAWCLQKCGCNLPICFQG